MPIYERKQFCREFGVTSAYITTNAGRRKLVLQGKYIDTDQVTNKEWLAKNADKIAEYKLLSEEVKIEAAQPVNQTKKEIIIPPAKKRKKQELDIPDVDDNIQLEQLSKTELETAKKKLEIKKLQEDYELAKIKKEKQLGLVVPTELVYGSFARHFKSITDQFYQAADNIVIEMSQKFGSDNKAMADMRSRLADIINKSVEKAKDESKTEIDSLVNEYSEKNSRGEKK